MSRGIALFFLRPSVLEGGGGSAPRPGRLYPRERPGTHFTEGWVGPRAGLDGRKIKDALHILQGGSLARGPKLLSIKNYVIEIMT